MHDIISFLRGAIDRTDERGLNGCYIVRDGSIYARCNSHQAGVAFASDANFNIPASALDAALARMKTVESLTVDADTIIIKAGRLKSTIRCHPDEAAPIPDMPDVWSPCPAGLTAAIKLALPFVGEEGWSSCVELKDEKVRAFSSARGIEIDMPGLEMEAHLITKPVVEFLIAQGDPDEYVPSENVLMFRWDDGRWLRAQLFNGAMPDLSLLFERAGAKAPVLMSAEWKEAYGDAAALADHHVTVTPEGFEVVRGGNDKIAVSDIAAAVKGLPNGHRSHWVPKVVDEVVACADAWNPAAFPEATLFVGKGFRGVVMGIRV